MSARMDAAHANGLTEAARADARAEREHLAPGYAEALERLARIEARLAEGERRFASFDEHVKGCTTEKQTLQALVSELKGKVEQMDKAVSGLRLAVFGFLGAVLVAGGILLNAVLKLSAAVATLAGSIPVTP